MSFTNAAWFLRLPSFQIEYMLVTLSEREKTARLALVGPNILSKLQEPEHTDPDHHTSKWRPEYASYMIEGRG